MNHEDFEKIVNEELNYVKELLCSKSKEYDFGNDRFHSFKVGGILQNETQMECLRGYLTKHIVSIYDLIAHPEGITIEKWQEKITDYINYGLLLLGMAIEEEPKNVKKEAKNESSR